MSISLYFYPTELWLHACVAVNSCDNSSYFITFLASFVLMPFNLKLSNLILALKKLLNLFDDILDIG